MSRPKLLEAARRCGPEVERWCERWYRVARWSSWTNLGDLRQAFPSAGQVGRVLSFDVVGNRYRLIVRINYRGQELFFKALLTHAGYDRKEWLQWA